MSNVVLSHPSLPADQTITVAAAAVHHYTRSGWQAADLSTPVRTATKPPAEPVITDPATEPVVSTKE